MWEAMHAGQTITLGNVVLTIDKVEYTPGGNRIVRMSVNSGARFDRLYTKAGAEIVLPSESYIGNNIWGLTVYDLSENLLVFGLTTADAGASKYSTISSINANGQVISFKEAISGSKLWEAKVGNTKITWDKTATQPAQYSAKLEY